MLARFLSLALITLCSSSAMAQGDYMCQSAIQSYNSALESISSSNRRYISCVSGSRGTDDCSFQFSRLRSAQYDFESAVSSYGSSCRRY